MPAQQLSGTTALVTGASQGFGRAIAVALSKHGAHVAVARDHGRLEELCALVDVQHVFNRTREALLRELRFLPEATFRGRQNAKFQYAVLAAAAVHGGTEPDLLDEVASWQGDDFWQYAVYAAIAYIRAAASRAGVPVRQACQDLDERLGHPAP